MITVGTHGIEESEAGVRQVVDQDHLHQGLGSGPGPGSYFPPPSFEKSISCLTNPKMTEGSPEVRSDKRLTLLTFNI